MFKSDDENDVVVKVWQMRRLISDKLEEHCRSVIERIFVSSINCLYAVFLYYLRYSIRVFNHQI